MLQKMNDCTKRWVATGRDLALALQMTGRDRSQKVATCRDHGNDVSRPDPKGRRPVVGRANNGSRPDPKGRRPVVSRLTKGRDPSFGAPVI